MVHRSPTTENALIGDGKPSYYFLFRCRATRRPGISQAATTAVIVASYCGRKHEMFRRLAVDLTAGCTSEYNDVKMVCGFYFLDELLKKSREYVYRQIPSELGALLFVGSPCHPFRTPHGF